MTVYIAEEFTAEEADILRRYFTNLDQPVFALVNLLVDLSYSWIAPRVRLS